MKKNINIKLTGSLCSNFYGEIALTPFILNTNTETQKSEMESKFNIIEKIEEIQDTTVPKNLEEKQKLKNNRETINKYINKYKQFFEIYPFNIADEQVSKLIQANDILQKEEKTKTYKALHRRLSKCKEYNNILENFIIEILSLIKEYENRKIEININTFKIQMKKIEYNVNLNTTENTPINPVELTKHVDVEYSINLKGINENDINYKTLYYIVLGIKRFTQLIDKMYVKNKWLQKFFEKHMSKQIRRQHQNGENEDDIKEIYKQQGQPVLMKESFEYILEKWNTGSALKSLAINCYKENIEKVKMSEKNQISRTTPNSETLALNLTTIKNIRIKDFTIFL